MVIQTNTIPTRKEIQAVLGSFFSGPKPEKIKTTLQPLTGRLTSARIRLYKAKRGELQAFGGSPKQARRNLRIIEMNQGRWSLVW